jgi:hypothetical protein
MSRGFRVFHGKCRSALWAGAVITAAATLLATAGAARADSGLSGMAVAARQDLVGGLVNVDRPSDTDAYVQFPFAESFPSATGGRGPRIVIASYNENVDSRAFAEQIHTVRSVDGGRTFARIAEDVPASSLTQLADGSLLSVNFRTAVIGEDPPPGPVAVETPTPTTTSADTASSPATPTTDTSTTPTDTASSPATTPTDTFTTPTDTSTTPTDTASSPATPTTDPPTTTPTTSTTASPPPSGGHVTFQTSLWRSTDLGVTWSKSLGVVSAADRYDALWFHRGIITGRDGALLAPMYGYLHGDPSYRTVLAKSTDRGVTWRIISTVATLRTGAFGEGRTEPTMARAANGDLLVVMRQNAPVNPTICGGTTDRAHALPLVISRSQDDGQTWTTPVPLNAPGDAWAVSSADPHLIMSPNGQLVLSYGRPYTKVVVSTDGNGYSWTNLATVDSGRSSGYSSLVALDATTFLQFGDHGSNWCFAAGSGAQQVGMWSRKVTLRPADPRRIDLERGIAVGAIHLQTNLTAAPNAASGPMAAVDNNTDPYAAAVGTGTAGYYQIDLGGVTALTAGSVALPDPGQSAAVDVSADGRSWRSVAGWSSSGQYRTLTDRSFPAGTTGRFVRVRVTSRAQAARLGEVQLRTTASTFEDDLVGSAPLGFVTLPAGAQRVSVAGVGQGLNSDRAVRLHDVSNRERVVMAKALPVSTTRTLELALRPNRIASAFLITLDGRKGTASQVALHLGVFPDGSLRRWTGSRWLALSAAGLVHKTGWAGVRINATTSGANVYVNGRLFSRVPLTPGTTRFTGIEVSSGGTAPVGDDMLIDQFRAS